MLVGTMIKDEYKTKLSFDAYNDAHVNEDCKGQFELIRIEKLPLNLDSIGYIQLPNVPMVSCPKCDAAYMLPDFENFIERLIATKLLISPNALSSREIKFLRFVTDSKQKEVADFINCDRSYYSKCESEKSSTHKLSIGKQKFLKVFHSKKLGLLEEAVENLDFLLEDTISREELNKAVIDGIKDFSLASA